MNFKLEIHRNKTEDPTTTGLRIALISTAQIQTPFFRPWTPWKGDERLVSLYQRGLGLPTSSKKNSWPLKAALLRALEILQNGAEEKKEVRILQEISPPRTLRVPQLPHPPFRVCKPARFFPLSEEYTPACLMIDTAEEIPATLYYFKHRPALKGTLREAPDRLIYLEISSDEIQKLHALINDSDAQALDARVPVILPNEWDRGIDRIDSPITFKMIRLCRLKRGEETIYFASIKSEELENLRERYLLTTRLRGHDFHIPIALKREKNEMPPTQKIYRLNVSCFAA